MITEAEPIAGNMNFAGYEIEWIGKIISKNRTSRDNSIEFSQIVHNIFDMTKRRGLVACAMWQRSMRSISTKRMVISKASRSIGVNFAENGFVIDRLIPAKKDKIVCIMSISGEIIEDIANNTYDESSIFAICRESDLANFKNFQDIISCCSKYYIYTPLFDDEIVEYIEASKITLRG